MSTRLLLYIFFIALLASCKNTVTKTPVFRQANSPDEHGEDIVVTYTDSGDLRARLHTPLAEHYRVKPKDPYLEMKKGLTVYFYGINKDTPESMLRANYGIKYEKTRRIIVKDDVVVVNINHDTLNTEYLIWDENTRKISSDKFVRIKKPKETLYGYGFESNEDFTNYKIFKISGSIMTNDANTK